MGYDVLSGGTIDQSTSGPIPSNTDTRSTDLIEQQKTRQQQDAIGGTEFAPRPQPPPSIPDAVDIAPPLPNIPSFSFDVMGSGDDASREAARQAAMDVIKNVTINGQGPTIEGSSISFDIGKSTQSASEAFSFDISNIETSQNPVNFLQSPSAADQTEQNNLLRNEFNRPSLPPPPEANIPETSPPPPPQHVGSANAGQDAPTRPKQPEQPAQPQNPAQTQSENPKQDVTDKEISASEVRAHARFRGEQTTQKNWDNYATPQEIRSSIEESETKSKQHDDAAKSLEPPKTNSKDQETKDYSDGNTPSYADVLFTVCLNGEARNYLIGARGPF